MPTDIPPVSPHGSLLKRPDILGFRKFLFFYLYPYFHQVSKRHQPTTPDSMKSDQLEYFGLPGAETESSLDQFKREQMRL